MQPLCCCCCLRVLSPAVTLSWKGSDGNDHVSKLLLWLRVGNSLPEHVCAVYLSTTRWQCHKIILLWHWLKVYYAGFLRECAVSSPFVLIGFGVLITSNLLMLYFPEGAFICCDKCPSHVNKRCIMVEYMQRAVGLQILLTSTLLKRSFVWNKSDSRCVRINLIIRKNPAYCTFKEK